MKQNDRLFKAIMFIFLLVIAAGILGGFCGELMSQKNTLLNVAGYVLLGATIMIFAIIFGKIINKFLNNTK